MASKSHTKSNTDKKSHDFTKPPSPDLQLLIEAQLDSFCESLRDEADDFPPVAKMMRRYLTHLKPFDKKLQPIAEDQLTSSKGIGKAMYEALKNAKRRFEASAMKEKLTANEQSEKEEEDVASSEPE